MYRSLETQRGTQRESDVENWEMCLEGQPIHPPPVEIQAMGTVDAHLPASRA